MLELLFLLLPVAAAYGWFMGRNSVRQEQRKEQEQFSKSYVTGINLLLSAQSDKAIDIFIDMLDVDSETIETHWTLGNLFRRRGEIDRALRIHRNLMNRPSLSESQRQQALLELGKDYLAAGLYDRAERKLLELSKQTNDREETDELLLQIYEATNEWDKAIKIALKVRRYDPAIKMHIAHFYCELAALQSDIKQTLKFYEKALKHDEKSVRAALALGHWWLEQKNYHKALAYLLPIRQQAPDYMPEALSLIEQAYQGLQDTETFLAYLYDVVLSTPSATAVVMLADQVVQANDRETAELFILTALRRNPTMRGFHKLIELHIANAESGREKASLELLRDIVAEQLQQRSKYHCSQCGFASQTLYWHCPSCKSWGSIKPTQGLDGE